MNFQATNFQAEKLGGHMAAAVSGIDLRVNAGELFAFLGPNGAG